MNSCFFLTFNYLYKSLLSLLNFRLLEVVELHCSSYFLNKITLSQYFHSFIKIINSQSVHIPMMRIYREVTQLSLLIQKKSLLLWVRLNKRLEFQFGMFIFLIWLAIFIYIFVSFKNIQVVLHRVVSLLRFCKSHTTIDLFFSK